MERRGHECSSQWQEGVYSLLGYSLLGKWWTALRRLPIHMRARHSARCASVRMASCARRFVMPPPRLPQPPEVALAVPTMEGANCWVHQTWHATNEARPTPMMARHAMKPDAFVTNIMGTKPRTQKRRRKTKPFRAPILSHTYIRRRVHEAEGWHVSGGLGWDAILAALSTPDLPRPSTPDLALALGPSPRPQTLLPPWIAPQSRTMPIRKRQMMLAVTDARLPYWSC